MITAIKLDTGRWIRVHQAREYGSGYPVVGRIVNEPHGMRILYKGGGQGTIIPHKEISKIEYSEA